MKKPWQSWKDYAKKLELDLKFQKSEQKYLNAYDILLRKHINFPSMDAIDWYLREKARLNTWFAARVLSQADANIPDSHYAKADVLLGSELADFKRRLKTYLGEEGEE